MLVLCRVGKNIIFQNKTLLVKCYRHNKTCRYQFCHFKHFLKAENSEDSLASSCEEFCIGFHVIQFETGLLLSRTLAKFTQLKINFIMLVGVQGSLFHIAAGSHPVQNAWGHKIVCTGVKFKKLL